MAQKISDEQRVIDYLSRLMAGKFFKVEDLDSLTVGDLLDETPIQDVDRTIVENTLDYFKKRYKAEIFKDN
ncbi:hypothetical protein KJ966_22120 [bacterium]|nr:hypothetical protein [bacterium]